VKSRSIQYHNAQRDSGTPKSDLDVSQQPQIIRTEIQNQTKKQHPHSQSKLIHSKAERSALQPKDSKGLWIPNQYAFPFENQIELPESSSLKNVGTKHSRLAFPN
jgi:hypothetical protein